MCKPISISFVTALLWLTPICADDAEEAIKKLAGTWTPLVLREESPQAVIDFTKVVKDVTGKLTIKADTWQFRIVNDSQEATIKVDPSQSPASIDLKMTAGKHKGKTLFGIYEVSGNMLKFRYNVNGIRPKEFKAGENDDGYLVEFKRDPAKATTADGKEEKGSELLASAKQAIRDKNTTLARVRLNIVINEYGTTAAAVEARKLLKTLAK